MSHPKAEQLFKRLKPLKGGIPIHTFDVIINSLFLLRHLNSEFEKEREKVIEQHGDIFADDKDFYSDNAQCFLEKEARGSEIIHLSSRDENVAILLDRAFHSLEQNNRHVKGILKSDYFTSSNIAITHLKSFMKEISRTYEEMEKTEFLEVFQDYLNLCAEERSEYESRVEKNKLHTPVIIAKLLVALADPYEGNIYDPCCGTAGLLVEAAKYIRKGKSTLDNVFFYGQELSEEMNQFARINQAINGCEFKLSDAVSTFAQDHGRDKKMDCILANFPMNQKNGKDFGGSSDNSGWQIFGTVQEKNGNWAGVSFIVHKLSECGIATFLLPQKELDSGETRKFRKGLVEKDLIEAIILLPKYSVYRDEPSLAIVVINKDKQEKVLLRGDEKITYRSREDEILYIDMSEKRWITNETIEKIINIFNSGRHKFVSGGEGFVESKLCKSIDCERIKNKNYFLSLAPYCVTEEDNTKNLQQIEELKKETKIIEKRLIQLFECEKGGEEKFKELVGGEGEKSIEEPAT